MVATRSVGYRNRVRLRVDEHGLVTTFNPRKSEDCVVLTEGLHEAMRRCMVSKQVRDENPSAKLKQGFLGAMDQFMCNRVGHLSDI